MLLTRRLQVILLMRIHCIQHGDFDEPGAITNWALMNGHTLSCTKTFKNERLPNITAFDFLIILGGTQSLVEERYPDFINNELKFIKHAIENGKLILGICLGAQMIAECLSAKTQRSPHPEIGIFPITLTPEGEADHVLGCLSQSCEVMHMHYDMPGLIDKAKILASSQGCPHQAFTLGRYIYGIQFHLEMTNENIQSRLTYITQELETGPYVATREQLMRSDMAPLNKKMFRILDNILLRFNSV